MPEPVATQGRLPPPPSHLPPYLDLRFNLDASALNDNELSSMSIEPSLTPAPPFDEAALRQRVLAPDAAPAERIAAFEDLIYGGAEGLDALLWSTLEEEAADSFVGMRFILVAARIAFRESSIRTRMASRMFSIAISLRDSPKAGVEQALWAAVRTFAVLAPLEQVSGLVEFLRPEDTGTTRQVAFQAVQQMLELEPVPATQEVMRLAQRTRELAMKYLDNDILTSPEAVALATTAYCAAMLIDAPDSHDLTTRLVSLRRGRMLQRCRSVILEATQARGRRALSVDSLVSNLAIIDASFQ